MRQTDKLHLEFPFAGSRMLRDLLGCRWSIGGTASCHNFDAENGHRSGLSQAQHIETAPGHKNLSVSVCGGSQSVVQTRSGGATDIFHLHSDGARLRLSVRRDGFLLHAEYSPGVCPIPWRRSSAWRFWKTRSPSTAGPRIFTPIHGIAILVFISTPIGG